MKNDLKTRKNTIIDIKKRIENKINYEDHTMLMDYCTLCYYISKSSIFDDDIKKECFQSGKSKLNYLITNINKFKLAIGVCVGFVGLGYLLNVYNVGNEYNGYIDRVNQFVKKTSIDFIREAISKTGRMENSYYDIINGVSSVGIYILEFDTNDLDYIKTISTFLNQLILSNSDEEVLSNFKIHTENIRNLYMKNMNCDGYIDLSLSHGVLGCLAFLTKSLKIYNCEDTKKSIDILLKKYVGYLDFQNELYFPTTLFYDIEKSKYVANFNKRLSWCYGALGGLRVLYEVTKCLDYHKDNKIIETYIKNIANHSIEDLELICPTFCHGYSGALYIYNKYKNEGIVFNKDFINNLEKKIWSFQSKKNEFHFLKYETDNKGNVYIIEDRTSSLDGVVSILITVIMSYDFNGIDYVSKCLCIDL